VVATNSKHRVIDMPLPLLLQREAESSGDRWSSKPFTFTTGLFAGLLPSLPHLGDLSSLSSETPPTFPTVVVQKALQLKNFMFFFPFPTVPPLPNKAHGKREKQINLK
jgi:hypothetical protein